MGKTVNYFKKYRIGIDLWALALFALVMIPNLVFFCVPALQERIYAQTNAIDIAASVFQAIFVILLVFVVRREQEKPNLSAPLVLISLVCLLVYYIAWIFVYCDYVNDAVQLFLAVLPCASFILFEIERRHWIALVPTALFSALHVVSIIMYVVS